MTIQDIVAFLDSVAPLSLQEEYDNAGLLVGDPSTVCTGVLCTLDVTERVIEEAIAKKCNCIVAHHPLIFRGLKKIMGTDGAGRALIAAIRNNIAIYASHTNLDNLHDGVNAMISEKLGLRDTVVMEPRAHALRKLYTYVPPAALDKVREALFSAGAGNIGAYAECSFTHAGTGTFRPGEGTNPFVGEAGTRENTAEIKLETVFPAPLEASVIKALKAAHPYEEVAFDIIRLENAHGGTGAGLIGEVDALDEATFLSLLVARFSGGGLRHTALTGRSIKRVAVCGGAGSFLIPKALGLEADAFVTSDLKYHEFFIADGRMLLCDIGHYESEQFTADLLAGVLQGKFPTFAVLKSAVVTNPVCYFPGK